MEKLDLTKKYKSYYQAKNQPELVELEAAQFLSITGKGDPSGKLFSEKIQALYASAYTVKFACKELKNDFVVPKLEGLWSFDKNKYSDFSMMDAPAKVPRDEWGYRLMIRMPAHVTPEQIIGSIETVLTKKKILVANEIELFKMDKEKAVQMLHSGPFSSEPETLKLIQEFMLNNNLIPNGLHHEIYLSDFTKTNADKLKTILREPVK